MLKKRARLTSAAFAHYFASGTRTHTPLFTLIYTPHEHFHGAVVVPKKVAKKAVKRNQLRRRVYDALRRIHIQYALSGVCIILVKPAIERATHADIVATLSNAIGRATSRPVE